MLRSKNALPSEKKKGKRETGRPDEQLSPKLNQISSNYSAQIQTKDMIEIKCRQSISAPWYKCNLMREH